MLKMYNSQLCLIDTSYKITVYDMPLFSVCVFTSISYVNAATFMLSAERQQSVITVDILM